MASVLRFTVGEWTGLTDDDLKEIREGRDSLSKERLSQLSKMIEKSFLFNGLKIPYIEVRWDSISETELQKFIEFHSGKTAGLASLMVEDIKQAQAKRKDELLQNARDTLRSKPAFLSILRDVVSEKISIETAMEMTGNSGVFQRGV
jgi:hypothetical protein